MNTAGVQVESIQCWVALPKGHEFVVIHNGSTEEFNLKGWRLTYEDLSTGQILHTHPFRTLRTGSSFAPGERLCVMSDNGEDRFQKRDAEKHFPVAHWDLFTGVSHHILTPSVNRARVSLLNEADRVIASMSVERSRGDTASADQVFIVHGHDEGLKQEVARFVEKLGLTAVILAEQPSQGRTVIEKLESHGEKAGFAIVLLTPDDVGGVAGGGHEQKPRARQNVILELGYFVAMVGRAKVCALHRGNVELPSDIHGVIYVSVMHDWKLALAREMKAANLPVDMNKL
jgi:predicted nucleotide-binding protein